ncbi:MAG: phosphodiester glycosidase family protein [Caldilineae bacterium]|nr:MAG: phosphodiester glycosidase family protein [Caldilineae bacterium]
MLAVQAMHSGNLSGDSVSDDLAELIRLLARADPPRAADELRRLMDRETELARQNRLAPYADRLPQVLARLSPERLALLFEHLTPRELRRALFGNFRVVPWQTLVRTAEAMAPAALARLLGELALGVDLPRSAARLLADMKRAQAAAVLPRAEDWVVIRLAPLMLPQALADVLRILPSDRDAARLTRLLVAAPPPCPASLSDALRRLPPGARQILSAHVPQRYRRFVEEELSRSVNPRWEAMGMVDLVEMLHRKSPEGIVRALMSMSGRRQITVLKRLGAPLAAATLTALGHEDPTRAGALLAGLGEYVWVRGPDGSRRRLLFAARGAAVLEHLDPEDPAVAALLQHVPSPTLHDFLARAGLECRRRMRDLPGVRAVGFAPAAYPVIRCRGRRRSRRLSPAMRWIRIRESVQTDAGPQPMRIDLLELDTSRVRLCLRRAITEERLVAIAEAKRLLGEARRGGERPDPALFQRLGIVRLSEQVAATGAIAGINGNFYFDYGHYLDAHDLGIDLLRVPGLHFGDVIGWFVEDGVDVSPPVFNRAALVVTEDERIHIRRVFMTHVELPNGYRLTWDAVNPPPDPESRPEGVVLYNGLAGFTTPEDPERVDLAIARYRLEGVYEGGGAPIPLLGFVLSLPRPKAGAWLAGVDTGDRVAIGYNFPPRLGRVQQAMACGPLLVSDGQLDLDPDFEDFGEKDASVVPFSLTRGADTFHTARSFVMLRDGNVVLGTVSGTALGSGPPRVSMGMTFGELAQLCLDLSAEQAIALDGGGSSSLVAVADGVPRVLNVPTGGADVPEGEERFINTYWLVFER